MLSVVDKAAVHKFDWGHGSHPSLGTRVGYSSSGRFTDYVQAAVRRRLVFITIVPL